MTVEPPGPSVLLVGGVDIHLRLQMMKLLRDDGFEVAAAGSAPQPVIEAEGFRYFQYPLERELRPLADLRAVRALRRLIDEHRPSIVHAFDTKPGFLVPIAMRGLTHSACVRTITGMGAIFSEDTHRNRALRQVYRLCHVAARSRTDYTIFQNSTDMRFFVDAALVGPAEHRLIRGSGVELPDADDGDAGRVAARRDLGFTDEFIFVMVARLVRQKGVADALAAARAVLPTAPGARFLFIGPSGEDEPDGVSLDDLSPDHGQIRYLGPRSDVPDLLRASDVFVLPTRYREGVPRSLLEALATGRPAVVSDMPGCADPVRDADAGWIAATGDVEALADAMRVALDQDRSTLLDMGARGRREVERHYSLSRIAEETRAVYAAVSTRSRSARQ